MADEIVVSPVFSTASRPKGWDAYVSGSVRTTVATESLIPPRQCCTC